MVAQTIITHLINWSHFLFLSFDLPLLLYSQCEHLKIQYFGYPSRQNTPWYVSYMASHFKVWYLSTSMCLVLNLFLTLAIAIRLHASHFYIVWFV